LAALGEFQRTHSTVRKPRGIDRAEIVMEETRAPIQQYSDLSPRARLNNQSIDGVLWYARWAANLDVDRDLWNEAERLASSSLLGRR
jgi:hypothetical protein